MKSTNFLIASVDKQFNMFKFNVNEQYCFIDNIAEHIKRLEEISENHHFYVDEKAFEALGCKNFPLRFTRVFSKNPDAIPQSSAYRVHHIDSLERVVHSKERASPDTQIFFIGGSEFLQLASKYSKKLLMTMIDREHTGKSQVIDVFPLEFMKQIFTKRREIVPEMLEQIRQYKALVMQKQEKKKVTISANGMKIIEDNELIEIDPCDEILNTPNYMFYEYSR